MSTEDQQRRICIPVDGSPHCERAFQFYLENLFRSNDALLLVHVVEPPALPFLTMDAGLSLPTEEWHKMIQESNSKAQAIESEWSTRCTQLKLNFKFKAVSNRQAGEAVTQEAKAFNAKMIIIGNRGLGAARRTFLGSVSSYVVHHSGSIPVTVVPPKE